MLAQRRLSEALEREREAMAALLRGEAGAEPLRAGRDAYLDSYAAAGPGSWGRLIGALKLAVLAGEDAEALAARALIEVGRPDTAPAAYLQSLARVVLGEAPLEVAVVTMGAAEGTFPVVARALHALGAHDRDAYAAAVGELLADFEARQAFVTGVPIADTVLVLEQLALPRGLAAGPRSPLLPAG